MYLPTVINIEYWAFEISKLEIDILPGKDLHLNDEGPFLHGIIKKACNNLNKDVLYLTDNYKKEIVKYLILKGIVLDPDCYMSVFKTVAYSKLEYSEDMLKYLKNTIIICNSKQINIQSVIFDGDQPFIENKLSVLSDPIIQTMNLNLYDLSSVINRGGTISDLIQICKDRDLVYRLLVSNLTTLQFKVLQSFLLFKKRTSKDVKIFVNNENSSSILDAIKALVRMQIINDDEFIDTIFKYWLIYNL